MAEKVKIFLNRGDYPEEIRGIVQKLSSAVTRGLGKLQIGGVSWYQKPEDLTEEEGGITVTAKGGNVTVSGHGITMGPISVSKGPSNKGWVDTDDALKNAVKSIAYIGHHDSGNHKATIKTNWLSDEKERLRAEGKIKGANDTETDRLINEAAGNAWNEYVKSFLEKSLANNEITQDEYNAYITGEKERTSRTTRKGPEFLDNKREREIADANSTTFPFMTRSRFVRKPFQEEEPALTAVDPPSPTSEEGKRIYALPQAQMIQALAEYMATKLAEQEANIGPQREAWLQRKAAHEAAEDERFDKYVTDVVRPTQLKVMREVAYSLENHKNWILNNLEVTREDMEILGLPETLIAWLTDPEDWAETANRDIINDLTEKERKELHNLFSK